MNVLRAHRDFRRLWVAGFISDTGDWMLLVALPVLVYQATGSTLGTAFAFLIELIPVLAVTPFAGRLAERRNRPALLVAVSLIQAAFLLPLLAGAHLPILYGVIATQAALACVFDTTKNALLPTLVPARDLLTANSLIGLNQNLGRLLGASLGGLALAGGGVWTIVVGDAASFLLCAALVRNPHPAPPGTPRSEPGASEPGPSEQGTATARVRTAELLARRPIRAGLAVLALTAVAQGLFIVLFVVFVARTLHGTAAENGVLRGVQAIGAVTGGLLLARSGGTRPARLTGWSCLLFGVIALTVWNLPHATSWEPVYVALFIAIGVPSVGMVSGLTSALQLATAEGERGPLFALVGAVFSAGQAAGMITAGLLGERIAIGWLLDAQGVLSLLGGAVALRWLSDSAPDPAPRDRRAGLKSGALSRRTRSTG
ncbi:MFS transporter [Actinospica durhamensis]|uniref:MFS transporter n=1 Tax=Actinospica durhamensis TaxID=1508375 RepID=UPI0027DBF306|nr:MFS transporter [Actinospica durhamensis]